MASGGGVSHSWVLDNCKHSVKHYINLEKVIPVMVDKKILLNKKMGKALLKKKDKALFVDLLDRLTLEQFGEFLTVIRSIEEETKERPLMKIFSSSMENMKLEEGSTIRKTVSDFIKAADAADVLSPLPSEISVVAECKYPYPSGFLSGCKSQSFTKEGGMLYSPEHGVTVIIPEGAVPASVEKYMLGLYVYMRGPFSLPENTQLCSPIVWFHHHPRFRFEADITIKIPHCAIVAVQPKFCGPSASLIEDDSLSVVTVEEGTIEGAAQYALTRHLPADFSDGYHAKFAVRHFCPYGVIKHRKQKRRRSKKGKPSNSAGSIVGQLPFKEQTTTRDLQRSVSLQDEEGELYQVKPGRGNTQGDLKFCIARCMPRDRSTSEWTVDFLISHWNPTGTGIVAKLPNVESLDITTRSCYFTDDEIEFVPESWTSSNSCWTVTATETNVLLAEDVPPLPSALGDQLNSGSAYCLPKLTYTVQARNFPPQERLDCTINVQGAIETSKRGKPLFFKLQSTYKATESFHPRKDVNSGLQLYTVPYLYACMTTADSSNILQAISQYDKSFPLNLNDPDHIKFLMDISLQLTDPNHPQKLGQALHLEHYKIERIQSESPNDISWQVYSILREWLAVNYGCHSETTTLGALKEALSKIEIEDIRISDPLDHNTSLMSTSLDTIPVTDLHKSAFLFNLSEKLQCCWRLVGSLMGISKSKLDAHTIQCKNNKLHEQAYQMLLTWQKETVYECTTHGVVFKAVQRLHEHYSDIVHDAWLYCIHYLEQNNHLMFEATSIAAL